MPSTRAPDGDPLDAVIVWDGTSYPGMVIECRAVGVLRAQQAIGASGARERNDRLIVLPVKAPRWDHVKTPSDLNARARLEPEQFFHAAVAFENKDLELEGWGGPAEAIALIRHAASAQRA